MKPSCLWLIAFCAPPCLWDETHQILSSRMRSDSNYKTSLGKAWVQAAAEATTMGLCGSSHIWPACCQHITFQIHKRCSFVGLADAPPLHLSSIAQCLGECREAAAELPVQHPIQILFSQQQQSLWEARVEVIFCGCYMAASSPSGSDVSQPLGSRQLFCYCDRSEIFAFSSSLIWLTQGNHSKCIVPSLDPSEVSDMAPVDLSGTMI